MQWRRPVQQADTHEPENFLLSNDGPDAVLKAAGEGCFGVEKHVLQRLVVRTIGTQCRYHHRPSVLFAATDFGISRFLKPNEKLEDFCGTPTYMVSGDVRMTLQCKRQFTANPSDTQCITHCMRVVWPQAPEVFGCSYGFPSDVWSAGVMMYWLLCGDFPFKGRTKMDLGRKIAVQEPSIAGGVWDQITPDAKDCLMRMLCKDPSKRESATSLLGHKWFKVRTALHELGHLSS